MSERILKVPPKIMPVDPAVKRPLWSVMIPTYNCLYFLRQSIESVLMQDPGPDKMQIKVVDDCSTDGDVEALVKEIGKGRVEFFRQERNMGHHRNFETCLNHSRGEYIHLLHGDDLVREGFYAEIEKLFSTYPQAGAAFTKNGYIDEKNTVSIPESSLLPAVGILNDFLLNIAQKQMLQVVAMVVKRNVYEKLGGFFGVNYCEDWLMWIRVAAYFPVAYPPACLALYRGGQGNTESITSNAMMNGENFVNTKKAIDIVQTYLPQSKRRQMKVMAKKNYSMHIAKASNLMYRYSPEAAFIQAKGAVKMHQNIRTIYWVMKLYLLHFQKSINKKYSKSQPMQ